METSLNEKVEILKEWIKTQPHLPQKNYDIILRRFLHCCNESIEIAKQLIDLYYSMRVHIPEVFTNRDPAHKEIENILDCVDLLPLPKFTKENYQVLLYRLRSNDADKFDFLAAAKAFSIVSDVRLVDESCIADGEIPIFDMKYFSIKHLAQLVFPVLRKHVEYLQEALPIKLKQIHMVNASPFLDKILMLIKPVLKSEVVNMLHFHLPNSETLFEYIPRELLPEEYGGTIGKCDDLKKVWREKMLRRRSYFTDYDSYWKVDETKRPVENDRNVSDNQYFGMRGSFKTLSID